MNQKIGQSHVFVFDHVECNYGGAYSNISGIFTAPKSGIFAFLWTIMAEGTNDGTGQNYGEVDTELVVNSEVRRRAHADTEVLYDDGQATGFVIVHLNQGDLVFIRSQSVPQGNLQVNYRGGWTFSGWQIA
ncbi:hypothetical protein FSP39_001434 [Pinctada imbricata]|uniref:C1q domain-containing protein n=1 Tax=Pinctada imbricata TaxID=66713 RepID=A0AA88XV98_PINIB|nr:hypothetical protein FSP39_001434 [Pinctada imbricata]